MYIYRSPSCNILIRFSPSPTIFPICKSFLPLGKIVEYHVVAESEDISSTLVRMEAQVAAKWRHQGKIRALPKQLYSA